MINRIKHKLIIILSVFSMMLIALPQLVCQNICGLKYDYIWILGGIDKDTIPDENGGCEINFNTSPPSLNLNYKPIRNPLQNTSICSPSGDLLFYSNGCSVFNSIDEIMENGDTLNPGEIFEMSCPQHGYVGFQNMFAIPDSYNDSIYYLFYLDLVFNREPNAPFIVQPEHLYCTTIDMAGDNGHGMVKEKNMIILQDTSMMGDPMSAVKHANGIDWWIITPNRWSNSFNRILLDSGGPHFVDRQYIGMKPDSAAEGGQGKFSPDGSHFAWFHPRNGLFLYDFDREEGLLSNFRRINIPHTDFISGGCEFSPTGRFLYVNHDTSLFQLDMLAPDIQSSLTHIADFDGFTDVVSTYFFFMERTPDKRIIMNVLNGSEWLHVIQEPDKKGAACRFEQHAIKLPTINNLTIPHFPNYRLGALGDPLCDSLMVSTEPSLDSKEDIYKIVPNPASDYITIQYSGRGGETPVNISITDISGQTVLFSHELQINISNVPAGFYILTIMEEAKLIQQSKLIISNR